MTLDIHTLLLHLSFLCIGVLSQNECSSYTCKPSQMAFDDETCIYYDQTDDVYYSKECSGNTICNGAKASNMTCATNQHYFGLSYPGDKCQQDSDCIYSLTGWCSSGVCQGGTKDVTCNSNLFCVPGYTCFNYIKCVPQIEIGQKGCLIDTDCVNNAACNITSTTDSQANTCYQVFTFEPHEPVGSCLNGESQLCKYINCAQNEADGDFYCTNLLASKDNYDASCQVGNPKCHSQPDNFFNPPFVASSVCDCGYNAGRNAYCSLFYGDGPGVKMLSYWAKWFSSPAVLKCNTANRKSFKCMQDYWDEKSFTELYYWYTYFYAYNLIVGSEKCVIGTAAFQYAYASELNGVGDYDDSAVVLGISMAIAFIFS
ncbi:unnamed protein product [Blepharisma stoltei]|uniref:Dickkopf N-terminal cysteine-rich domain-containing protein n=1 Tax=Blepharisma stoltei TaxID=1481888 RepID=A0AAU9JNC9_9CILI|nr:unnamed protein product [Blepharisma stoltei]